MIYSFPAVRFVLHFDQEGNIQPFLEGQRLGTVHIIEGTSSQA